MHKLFLLEDDPKCEGLEVLAAYIMPTLKLKAQVIKVTKKESQVLHLDILPALLFEDTLTTDFEKIVFSVCKLGSVDSLILKEAEIWALAKSLTMEKEMQGKVLLDKLNAILINKAFLVASHITLADILVILPAVRTLLENPVEKQIEWVNVYRWAEHLFNLPYLGNILVGKKVDLKPLALIIGGMKLKEEEKKAPSEKKEDKKGGDKQKKEKKKPAKKVDDTPAFSGLDIRVGKIVKVIKHPDSTKLYLEDIDIGNGEVRKIASGLQEHIKIEELQDSNVIVFCNLKPMKMAGVPSHGMVLCASDAEHKTIEVLRPADGAKPGDVVTVEGLPRAPVADINLSKDKNPWKKAEPMITTADDLTVTYEGKPLKTAQGPIKAKTLKAAKIS